MSSTDVLNSTWMDTILDIAIVSKGQAAIRTLGYFEVKSKMIADICKDMLYNMIRVSDYTVIH